MPVCPVLLDLLETHIDSLRKAVNGEEFDYLLLTSHLQQYSKPRDKISRLLRSGDIIRVKKGIYVFGERYRRGLINPEVLANMIYGPSYVSLEYALAYCHLIPEYVYSITSMTPKKNKIFDTSLGRFSYYHLPEHLFGEGIVQKCTYTGQYYLIATPERAIADRLLRESPFCSPDELLHYLVEGVRIEEEDLAKLKKSVLRSLAATMKHPTMTALYAAIRSLQT